MEYKLYFTDADMLQYISARCNPVPEDPDTIPLPADADEFWQALRENYFKKTAGCSIDQPAVRVLSGASIN
jgi:hypothetical protein